MALVYLGGSLNESIRKRIMKDGNCMQAIQNYMFDCSVNGEKECLERIRSLNKLR